MSAKGETEEDSPSLLKLILDGDLEGVRLSLEGGADVNQTKSGLTPVIVTAFMDDDRKAPAIFAELVKYNPNLEVKSTLGRNVPNMRALHFACAAGKTELAKAMMKAGADVNAIDGHGQTPLLRAMQNRHEEIIDSLLEYGANATISSTRGATPLILLADPIPPGEKVVQDWEKDARIASKMIQVGVDVNAKDDEGMSALHWSAKNGHVELATVLLKEGNANVNLLNDENQTALLLTTVFLLSRDTPESTKRRVDTLLDLLVANGADENAGSMSPFDVAMRSGRPDLVKRMDRHVVKGEDSTL